MRKIVINKCYGGFGLSVKGENLFKELKGITDPDWYYNDIARDDPVLIELVETLGQEIESSYAKLKIVEIPDDVEWEIEEYDGMEWVSEKHRTWS
jgi:hypothetical protein